MFNNARLFGPWAGNYTFVADPDPDVDGTDKSVPNAPHPLGKPLDAAGAAGYAASDVANIAGLASDSSFEGGGFSTNGAIEVSPSGILAEPEWLIPYYQPEGQLTGVALIDANTGALDAALWNEGGTLGSGYLAQLAAGDNGYPFPADLLSVPEPSCLVMAGTALMVLSVLGVMRRRAGWHGRARM